MGFITAYYSGKGGRAVNEDAILHYQNKDTYFAIVADGLGMHGSGEIASGAVVETLAHCFLKQPKVDRKAIIDYFDAANKAVLSRQTAACKMKSTAVALLSRNKKLAIAHVGDSRLYHFSKGKLLSQTEDHSVTWLAVSSGRIKTSQVRFHEDRNRLLRAMGGNESVQPEITILQAPVNENDSFLLCSDGFWEYVLESEMEIDLMKSGTPKQWISYMLERVGKRIDGKNDNLSVIAIFYKTNIP